MGHNPIDIEIQWRCTHCGHRYEQGVAICMPSSGSSSGKPKLVGSGSLVCRHCGQLGPIQVGCAIVLGLSIMAGSDGAVHMPLPVRNDADADCDRWVRDARFSSRN
jgi:hypothetical protein